MRRRHKQTADLEVRLLGQRVRSHGLHQIGAKIHRPVREIGERSDIGQPAVLAGKHTRAPNRAASQLDLHKTGTDGNEAECIADPQIRFQTGTGILGDAVAAVKSAHARERAALKRPCNGADDRRRSTEGVLS